jgi:hypothetical protein
MSQMCRSKTSVYRKKEPWTQADVLCYTIIGLLAYVASPPWVVSLARLLGANSQVYLVLEYFYTPLRIARHDSPVLDCLYHGYCALWQW